MRSSLAVLLVDDDEDDFILTSAMLADIPGAQYTLDWARSVAQGLVAWHKGDFDLILLDYRLGGETGLELLRSVRESGSQIPIIILTGLGDRDVDVAAMAAGATDYLVKNELSASLLDRALRYALAMTEMNQRLVDEHKRLMQVERLSSVGLLAASVAHEVNNPLAGVMSLVMSLREGGLSDDKRNEYFDAIEDGLKRMRSTIQGLLDFSREQPVIMADIELADVVTGCLRLMAATLRGKGLSTDVHLLPTDRVRGDRSRLMQAVLNLLVNAGDATPRGGTITLSCSRRDGKVGLTVRDTGSGIPQEVAKRVLEPFFTTKQSGHGTGLGLAIVHTIIKEHGGSLTIESEQGQGTVITLWLDPA